ncbi:hypothetical protein [Nonomuraea sp. NPDC052265]|uniref:hypothetical protein n=1 Tax=Nonomuraea sp. NPDC052265 TaxID=3364374 RepID=UPI0037C80C38
MDVKWAELGRVFAVSLIVGLAVVGVFSLGAVTLSDRRDVRGPTVAGAVAMACFAVCTAVVGYGLYLIVPQFH